ncbi:hypothetical protein HMPREF9460_00491 [Flavonifractor plautii 1_3_50AFAA]|uniref:ATPase dynein-related AAA domain-containing protein n=1 Tax=Flavonifractor plautii 1_3_50AFAA TaxID=742738 RepID=A0A096CQI7_FLAPL|nr:hypothetical protein HMPREF9460_00491 [Flavonifractor plautii 1_3_50AFAA]
MDRPLYPFTAVVGQERAKQALLCLAVEPRIGGVLLCGEKGTAKSTLVRALGGLDGVRLLELPVSATEDMLLGGVELEAAVRTGRRTFQPGLLARADGAVLYADEVNLLPSALTAALLDTLETGVCRVERDGISHTCPARFALVGTMNPEEGTLRPQLLDRFGLYVAVTGEREPEARKEVVRRRLAFEEKNRRLSRPVGPAGGAAGRAAGRRPCPAAPGGRGGGGGAGRLPAGPAGQRRRAPGGAGHPAHRPRPGRLGRAHLHQLGGSPHGGGAGPAPPQAGGKRRPAPATGERGGAPSGIWSGRTGRGRGWTGGRVPPRRRAAAGGGSGPRAAHGAGAVPRAVGAGGEPLRGESPAHHPGRPPGPPGQRAAQQDPLRHPAGAGRGRPHPPGEGGRSGGGRHAAGRRPLSVEPGRRAVRPGHPAPRPAGEGAGKAAWVRTSCSPWTPAAPWVRPGG